MYNFIKKPKFMKIVCFLLVCVFSINVAGCGQESNGVPDSHVKNETIGVGTDTIGYTVYSESTFDPMTKELFMGYLLNGRDFTLVVVPGSGDGSDDDPYEISNYDNYLFSSAQAGVYRYNEKTANFDDPTRKLLMYYVTDNELNAWFDEFASGDNFLNDVMDFSKSTVNLEAPNRFTCEALVNMGSGINANVFCNHIMKNKEYSYNGVTHNKVFSNSLTGGMILLFGYGSIEGYITYDHIDAYRGSSIANTLTDECTGSNCYDPSKISAFDYKNIVGYDANAQTFNTIGNALINNLSEDTEYSYTKEELTSFLDNPNSMADDDTNGILDTEDIKTDILYLYTETAIAAAPAGYQKLKRTYELIGNALLADYYTDDVKNFNCNSLKDKFNGGFSYEVNKKAEENAISECNSANKIGKIKWYMYSEIQHSFLSVFHNDSLEAIYDMADMIDSVEDFKKAAEKEAFNIKLSVALYSRYSKVNDFPGLDKMVTGLYFGSKIGKWDNGENFVSYDKVQQLMKGNDVGSQTNNSYLLLLTADGFVLDRGDEETQIAAGTSDMLGMSSILSELVRLDGCPNQTAAAKMYNLLSNLKIYAGVALVVAGGAAVVAAGIGLAVASVIAKLAMISSVTPVPGGRIVALVLAAIAGLIAIGAGIYSLFKGLEDKARLKGLGASETNYCQTYISTFNMLFESFELSIPIYAYEIPEGGVDRNLSLIKCDVELDENGKCNGNETIIPLYYYADKDQIKQLSPDGCPMLMYFKEGVLVDYIVGATTPSFIVEMLRLWGLMAMRELVYKAQIEKLDDDSNIINVYHTSNTNARTHTIYEARHCFTIEYGKNLYGEIGSNEICYDINGNNNYTTKLSSDMTYSYSMDISFPGLPSSLNHTVSGNFENYIDLPRRAKSLPMFGVDISKINESGLNATMNGLSVYDIYYSQTEGYKFNNYAKADGIELLATSMDMEIQIVDGKIKFQKKVGESYVWTDIDGNEVVDDPNTTNVNETEIYSGYDYVVYKGKNRSYYVINNNIFIGNESPASLTKWAMFDGTFGGEDDYKGLMYKDENNVEHKYGPADILDVLVGDMKFEVKESVIPIYFTATIKEAPQANDYYNMFGNKKYCDEGEYRYERTNTFMGAEIKVDKCLTDDKVKSKDDPYRSDDVNYYSTSVQVGTINIVINEKGETIKTISWFN